MPKLKNEELVSRLAFDFRTMQALASPIVSVHASRTRTDAERRRNEITSSKDGAAAIFYLAEFYVTSLVGPGEYHGRFDVLVDVLGGGNYPYSDPLCHVVSDRIPWSPHFLKSAPVCAGELWVDAKGRMPLAALIAHLGKLLNWDEPSRGAHYGGWNPEAIRWWKKHLGRPITPGLRYPSLPSELTHETLEATDLFRPVYTTAATALSRTDEWFRPVK